MERDGIEQTSSRELALGELLSLRLHSVAGRLTCLVPIPVLFHRLLSKWGSAVCDRLGPVQRGKNRPVLREREGSVAPARSQRYAQERLQTLFRI